MKNKTLLLSTCIEFLTHMVYKYGNLPVYVEIVRGKKMMRRKLLSVAQVAVQVEKAEKDEEMPYLKLTVVDNGRTKKR